MTLQTLQDMLLWSTLLNYGVLVVWWLIFLTARGSVERLHGRWFRLAPGSFDTIHYAGMGLYKLGILLFNLAPWIALNVVT